VIGKADGRGSWPLSVGHQIERAVHNRQYQGLRCTISPK
jgi:hypothetical protein